MLRWFGDCAFYRVFCSLFFLIFLSQIENLQEQLRDKDKQLGNLKDRVKSLQTDSSNTDTALATLEEALSEKVDPCHPYTTEPLSELWHFICL